MKIRIASCVFWNVYLSWVGYNVVFTTGFWKLTDQHRRWFLIFYVVMAVIGSLASDLRDFHERMERKILDEQRRLYK